MSSARPKIASPRLAFLLLLILCLFASLIGVQPARAQVAADAAVLLSATASDPTKTGPLQITLNFPADGRATGYTISRRLASAAANAPFTQIATIGSAAAPTATNYKDRLITVGTAYEYQVIKNSNVTASGYVVAGVQVPLPSIPANANADGSRGTLILIFASDTAADPRISAGLTQLTQDLIGDGWTVIPHSVGRDVGMDTAGVTYDHGDAVRAVKALIRQDYTADPVNVKAVLLFGHVPVPYSGNIAPDGHDTHVGAWPADLYYGDMGPETNWTDTSVNNTTADNPRTYNVPGDGKFDQGSLTGGDVVNLEVGRVDLADMPSFKPKTEADLLAQYLVKDHNYRMGFLNLSGVGRISDNFGYFNGEAFAANGFRNFAPFFGPNAVTSSNSGSLFPDLDLGNFQWTYGCGPGGPTGAGGVGATPDFAANDPHSTFYMLFGSFFGDWGYGFSSPGVQGGGNDFLRAPLATTTYGLTDCWGGRPDWSYQHMGLGYEIGYSARLTQNLSGGATHVALMGDPTLREHVVMPASGLTAVTSAADVQVAWQSSNQALNAPVAGVNSRQPSPVAGYNVYRQDSATGPFTLLNTGGLVTTTTYTDAGAAAATHTYQVRAVALQLSPSGTYYNQSQGVFQAFDPNHVAPTLTLVSPTKTVPGVVPGDKLGAAPGVGFYVNAAAGNPTVTLTIAAQATSSIPNDPGLTVTFYLGGVVLGTATSAPYQFPVTLPSGYYQISAVATDGAGATVSSNELPVYVFKDAQTTTLNVVNQIPLGTPDGDVIVYNGKLGNGWGDISNKNNNAMTDNLSGVASVSLNAPGASLVLSHVPIDLSLYPDPVLHLVMTGNTDGGKPGGQQLTISAPLQDTVQPVTVTLPGFNGFTEIKFPIAGIVGEGEHGRNMDGLVIQATNGNVPATPTFYIKSIYVTSDVLRTNRAAGVAIHLDQAKYAFASQATVPIVAKGDAATSDGAVVEVDLILNGVYIGRGAGQGTTPGMLYSPYNFTLPTLAPGSYTLVANAVTSFGTVSSSVPFTFVVVAPPTVAITAPANNTAFATGRPLTITATAAAGAGGNLANVQFFESFNGQAPVEIGADQTSGNSPFTVQFTPATAGTYTLTVIATDDAGGTTTSAPVTINVGDPPTVSITSPTNGQSFVTSTDIPVTATAAQGTNPLTQVQFFANGVAIGAPVPAPGPYTVNFNTTTAGSYALTAVATDSIGLTTTSAPVNIVVNAPPTITITAPANNAAFTTPATFSITANATPGNHPITQVQFFANGVAVGAPVTTAPYTVSDANVPAGTYTLTAVATDSIGLSTTSAPVTVTVSTPPTVVITAPANNAVLAASTPFTIKANATAGTSPIAKVDFLVGNAIVGTATAAPYTFTDPGLAVGTYTLTAVATDTNGLTATSAPVTVTVEAPPTITITAPLNNAAFAAPATFTITANATAGGSPITQVQFFANGVAVGAPVTTAPYSVSDANVPVGTYTLTAVVTDSAGLTVTSAPVTVVVSTPPTVTITAPKDGATFVAPATFSVTASVTAGTNAIAQVQFFANGLSIGTATTAPYTISDANVPAGTYTLTAVATDTTGLTATSAPITVVVNTPPTVTITAPNDGAAFAAPATFTIAATATAGSNPITQVQFFANGTLIGTATTAPYTVSDANVPVGTYALTAVVTDSAGLTATSPAVNVTVANAPTVSITAPANNATFVAPAAFTITASATPGSNPITQVQFFAGTTLLGTATTAPYTVNVSGLAGGTYTLTAVATDSLGLATTSAPITIVVNTPPAVAITAPVADASFVAPATFTITATATAGSNPITQVQFFASGTLIGTATNAPYSVSFANVPAGTYSLTAVATDSIGLTTTSAPVNVVVNAPPTVVITAPANGATAVSPGTFTVTASATAGSNPITQVQFFANGKAIGAPVKTAPYTVSFAGVAAGTYALTAVATDSAGLTATSAAVTVTVNSPPMVTITAPVGGAIFTSPATFDVTALPTPGSSPVVKVDFFANGQAIGTATASPYTVSFANVAAGTYGLTAVATDSAGLTATSATVTVVVNAGPTVSITAPTNGASFTAPTLIPVTATATAGSFPIVKVDFFANGQAIGTALAAPYTVNFNGATAGTYSLTARATDKSGQTATSTPVTITIVAGPTITITTPANNATFGAPATVPVTAGVTAGSNPITQVQFFANGTLIGTATAAPYTVNFAGATPGAYVLTAVATDSAGLTATSPAVNVTIVAPQPVFGLVKRSTDNSAIVGATVTFTNQATSVVTTVTTSAAATGPDGQPADYVLTSLAPGTYTVTVSSAGAVAPAAQVVRVVLGQALRVDFTFSPLHTFSTGLQMFSVPYDYSASGQTLSAILGIPNPRLVDWNPATMGYEVPTTFVLGMGYWANFPAGAGLVLQGVPASTIRPFTKALQPGWNIIGDPFLTSVPWTSVQIAGANGTGVSLATAASQRLIGPNLYTYNQTSHAYDTLPVAGGAGSLDPYVGYWIYAASAVTLIVSTH